MANSQYDAIRLCSAVLRTMPDVVAFSPCANCSFLRHCQLNRKLVDWHGIVKLTKIGPLLPQHFVVSGILTSLSGIPFRAFSVNLTMPAEGIPDELIDFDNGRMRCFGNRRSALEGGLEAG